jgi:predicted CopG family antitoxin
MKKITLTDDSYWKLLEIKAKLKCNTWHDTINALSDLVKEKERKNKETDKRC